MTKYRLNSAERVQTRIDHVARTKVINNKPVVTYSNYINLVPGKTYETDDEAMLSFFRAYRRKVRYNAELERALKQHSVPYDIESCRSCGGRIKKISYRVVEVLDE